MSKGERNTGNVKFENKHKNFALKMKGKVGHVRTHVCIPSKV